MTGITFAQLEAKLPALTEPAKGLPYYAPDPERVYRCGSCLHVRYSDHKAWCLAREPQSGCYCQEAS